MSSLSKASGHRVVSHEVGHQDQLLTQPPKQSLEEDLKGATLYSHLKEYLHTQDQLKENGYSFLHPEQPWGAINLTAEEKRPKDSSCRTCCRCGTEYFMSSSGHCVHNKECYYHWGWLRQSWVFGGWETQYMCCSTADCSVSCWVAKRHMQEGQKERPEGFVKTFEKELYEDAHPGIYALNCDMS
ncbi:RNA exonuclease 1 [Saguinus oedipus]|uniref:RNA exonuclease 1 n=1 Tax=Saguinus oedipus TaxID=9490 RepID=A0ABQ9UYB4_SAGOE|nr:RNA exonuclease 1 [Saguinus oedipus]